MGSGGANVLPLIFALPSQVQRCYMQTVDEMTGGKPCRAPCASEVTEGSGPHMHTSGDQMHRRRLSAYRADVESIQEHFFHSHSVIELISSPHSINLSL